MRLCKGLVYACRVCDIHFHGFLSGGRFRYRLVAIASNHLQRSGALCGFDSIGSEKPSCADYQQSLLVHHVALLRGFPLVVLVALIRNQYFG